MESIWGIFKANFHLAIKNNVFLSGVYLSTVPLLRGIANLDAARSAECLEQSVILIGILLIVPLNAPEQSKEIREVVCTRKIPHWSILLLRLIMATAVLIVMTGIFSGILVWKNCTFPFVPYMAGTVISAMALGSTGFLISVLGNSVVAGYLAAAGCFLVNLLGGVSDESVFYLFSMGAGSFTAKGWLFGGSIAAVGAALFYEKSHYKYNRIFYSL